MVKLDRPVDIKEFDLAVSSAYSGRGAVIENCHLHHGHVRGVLFKSPEALVKNCTIEHIHRHGIVLYAEQYWLEGPFPDDIKIVDNVLRNCGFASLGEGASITTTSAFGVPRGSVAHAYNIRDIEISGNRIVDAPGVAVKLVPADWVLVRNNTIIDPLSGLVDGKRLDFTRGIPVVQFNDVSRSGGDVFGRLTGNTRRISGKQGRGIELIAKGQFEPALFPIDEELRLPDTDYTVAFWFKTTNRNVRLCETKRYSSYNNRWSDHIVSVEGGKVRFQLQGDTPIETPDAFNDGQWHQVVTTVGPGGQRLYIDGQFIAAGKLERRTKTSNRLGLDLGPGGGNATVAIDELKIYGTALADNDVAELGE